MSKSLRTFSVLLRPCHRYPRLTRCRHSILQQNGQVSVRPVRFVRDDRWRTSKAAFQTALVLALTYHLFGYIDSYFSEDDDVASAKATSDSGEDNEKVDGKKDEDEGANGVVEVPETMPEDAIFIPLGFTRQRPQTYYKGTDPEWQSFIEFRKDRGRETAVRRELAGLVGGHFAGMQPLQKELGSPMKINKLWLDVLIPDGPPPDYERSGLEIADEYIAWTTRPVSYSQNSRLQAALWPLPMAKSFWASYSTYWSLQVARVKQFLNINSGSENSDSRLPSGMTDLEQLPRTNAEQESQAPTPMDKISDPKSSDISGAKHSSKTTASDGSRILTSLPPIPQVGGDMGSAVMAFKQTLANTWRPPDAYVERGAFLVSGLIQIEGPKGLCVVDVSAVYHPKQSRYKFISGKVRSLQHKKQFPRGDRPNPLE